MATFKFPPKRRGTDHPLDKEIPAPHTCADCAHWRTCRPTNHAVAEDEVCRWEPSRFQLAFRLDRDPSST